MNFPWSGGKSGKTDLEQKQKLERDVTLHIRERQKAERQIDELMRAHDAAESRYQQACIENRKMAGQHAGEIAMLTMEHSKSMGDVKKKHDREIDSLKKGHSSDLVKLQNSHGREVSQLNENMDKLKRQLLVNQDNNQGWPDDKLKVRFRELQRLIESVTSIRNKEFLIPINQEVGSNLDPTNFLHRVGSRKSHLLLKSTIWAILHEQFFSIPFCFGAIGPGKAHVELMEVYSTWRKLFDKPSETASLVDEDFAIFQRDKLANKWRSANFQCISVALEASDVTNPAPESMLAKLSADNFRQTVGRIVAVLSEVSRFSNGLVRNDVEDQIRKLVGLAHDVALQFGIQTAQLRLLVPSRGQNIQIGEDFHDCEDGDRYRGSFYTVDLVIVPGLLKIGDGRSDMSTQRTIVPCEIYPYEPPS